MKRRAGPPCQDFAGFLPATPRGLIAAPWTPASLSLFREPFREPSQCLGLAIVSMPTAASGYCVVTMAAFIVKARIDLWSLFRGDCR